MYGSWDARRRRLPSQERRKDENPSPSPLAAPPKEVKTLAPSLSPPSRLFLTLSSVSFPWSLPIHGFDQSLISFLPLLRSYPWDSVQVQKGGGRASSRKDG
ncbi:hypothetical protein IE53DRAFT_215184 [Violaceomyces palustris]|uniref:Uncharacterized protein n=1 Tax=Violaceomyces palustris TaxID=1673888 RepID=A0ACD0NQC6_9BASI|nr:hypothetical protein IE53DRAFT_215184 [Violaceomyces palustris]